MINFKTTRVTLHVLKRYEKYYVQLYGDNDGLILNAEHMRQLLRDKGRLMDKTELRNPQARSKKYPDTVYYRHDRLVFAVDAQQNKVITCFMFVGKRGSRCKPKARDRRAAETAGVRQEIKQFLQLGG